MTTATENLPSIRKRLSRVLLVMAVVWGLVVSVMIGLMLHQSLDTLLDQGLQESAEILYGLVENGGSHEDKAIEGILPAPPHTEALVWQLVGNDNKVLLRSHKAPTEALSLRHETGFSQTPQWRVYTLPLQEDRGRLQVAQLQPARHDTQWEILGGSMGVTLVVGLLSTFLMNLWLGRELRPLQGLSLAVARYNPLEPHAGQVLPEPERAELAPMVDAVKDLGRRLAARVEHERAFAAHAAHALRTPLAGMDAQLAVAMRVATPELQPRLNQTREAAARLRTVVTALISLFRAGGQMHWQPLELCALISHLPVRGASVTVHDSEKVWADPDLLSAALMNLLDNAVRYHGTQIDVTVAGIQGGSLITMTDNGMGMDAERARQINAALQSQERSDALGLGLTLTQLVARTHGGEVRISPRLSAEGRPIGTEVQLRLGPPPAALLQARMSQRG